MQKSKGALRRSLINSSTSKDRTIGYTAKITKPTHPVLNLNNPLSSRKQVIFKDECSMGI